MKPGAATSCSPVSGVSSHLYDHTMEAKCTLHVPFQEENEKDRRVEDQFRKETESRKKIANGDHHRDLISLETTSLRRS